MKYYLLTLVFLLTPLLSLCQLNVLSWNVQMRPIWLFPFDRQITRSDYINQFIQDYDVVVLQEAFEKKSHRILRPGFNQVILPSKFNHSISNGLMILSKYPIDFYKTIYFDSCRGFDCLSSKGATLFQITKDSIKYQFITTHLQSGDGVKNDHIRLSQIRQIKKLMTDNYHIGVNQMLLGDLNQNEGSNKFEEILNLKNCNTEGCTWFSDTKTQLLDYIFSNFEIETFSIETVELSDHFPIRVIIN
jgi:endonuclease/exonuclease/phosphatase family metal-dependent hydrolase